MFHRRFLIILNKFRINAENMSEDRYAYYISRISEVADKMTPHPTPFEMETAAAFLYFKEEQCDVVLIEVGMGGREDATNIIPKSLVSVITSISMDHMKLPRQHAGRNRISKVGYYKKQRTCRYGKTGKLCNECHRKRVL